MSYSHLSAQERLELYRLKQQYLSQRAIARHLGRSPGNVCRELKRNQSEEGLYLPDTVNVKMQQRRQAAKTAFVGISRNCISQLKTRLQQYHNLQQIAGRLRREGHPSVSYETIYQMIYQDYQYRTPYEVFWGQSGPVALQS